MDELAEDDSVIAGESEKLGQEINAYVAAYKARAIGRSQGRCHIPIRSINDREFTMCAGRRIEVSGGRFRRIRTSIAATRRSVK